MKKFPSTLKFWRAGILPVLLILTAVLFLSPEANAQTIEECDKIRARASYNCLTGWTKCYYPCVDQTKDVSACYKTCTQSKDACEKQVEADYKACLSAKPKTPTVSEVDEGQSKNLPTLDSKKETSSPSQKEGPSWLEFLGINPYQTWLRLREVAEVSEFFASGDLEESLEGGFLNLFGRKSISQKEAETKPWWYEEAMKEADKKGRINDKVEADAWIRPVPQGEPVFVVIPGMQNIKKYSWGEDSGAVMQSSNWEKIKFQEPVKANGVTSHIVELSEGEIEVRVRNNNPTENKFGVDAGWLGVTVSRTHFWVLKDTDKKLVAVVVYEGEVEVKTKDGKTVSVKPEGDKPGVMVIAQKLSLVKVGIVSLVLIAIIGGTVLFLKKRSKGRK
ncbi:MAG: FecR domain-containing protein [Candidatus Levybacteria bacterium]|nr:FecR domain-containing protein [Candidatus Levybacteria bacterium]